MIEALREILLGIGITCSQPVSYIYERLLFTARPLPKTVKRIFWNASNIARSAYYNKATSELPTTCTYRIYMSYNNIIYIC